MSARELLDSGLRWAVGNGQIVRLWKDAWLAELPRGRIHSTAPQGDLGNSNVASWRVDGGQEWDEQGLKEYLTDEELKIIKRVTLAEADQPDVLCWKHTKNGDFSVKSAYHAEVQRRSGCVEASWVDNTTCFWKKIWHAAVPEKVKNLVWRAVNKGLPNMLNLSSRGVNVHPICPRCGEEFETLAHLFFLGVLIANLFGVYILLDWNQR